MAPEPLRRRLRLAFRGDIDAAWDAWCLEINDRNPDPNAFVAHLQAQGRLVGVHGPTLVSDDKDPWLDELDEPLHGPTEDAAFPSGAYGYLDDDEEDIESMTVRHEEAPIELPEPEPMSVRTVIRPDPTRRPTIAPPQRTPTVVGPNAEREVLPTEIDVNGHSSGRRAAHRPAPRPPMPAPTPAPLSLTPSSASSESSLTRTRTSDSQWWRSVTTGGITSFALIVLLGTLSMVISGAGVGAALWQRHASDVRTRQLVTVLTLSSAQANRVESGLVALHTPAVAAAALTAEAASSPTTWRVRLRTPADFRADAPSPHPDATLRPEGTPLGPGWVSPTVPVLASGSEPKPSWRAATALATRHLPSVLDEHPAAEVVWVGLENGLYLALPGHSGLAEGYDPQTDSVYRAVRTRGRPVWRRRPGGAITLGRPILAPGKGRRLIGVAGVDVSSGWLQDTLLPSTLRGTPDVYGMLLDGEASIVATSHPDVTIPLHGTVADAARTGGSGYVFADEASRATRLHVYHHLAEIGWTYVMVGPADLLLNQ
ncbi:MAG: cache domain-containing protein [Myxococcales bacterium]|nr:cache domain-containing protein [Myxococcales bacterium]